MQGLKVILGGLVGGCLGGSVGQSLQPIDGQSVPWGVLLAGLGAGVVVRLLVGANRSLFTGFAAAAMAVIGIYVASLVTSATAVAKTEQLKQPLPAKPIGQPEDQVTVPDDIPSAEEVDTQFELSGDDPVDAANTDTADTPSTAEQPDSVDEPADSMDESETAVEPSAKPDEEGRADTKPSEPLAWREEWTRPSGERAKPPSIDQPRWIDPTFHALSAVIAFGLASGRRTEEPASPESP
ncbi:MAG: hypothetical protein AAGA03_10880 [Planctomycetota bacterium]